MDGKIVADQTPLYRYSLAAGRHEVKVYFTAQGAFSPIRGVSIEAGKETRIGFKK